MTLVHSNENLPNLLTSEEVKECAICKKAFELDDVLVSTPCNHIFHKECIVKVLEENQSCAVCFKLCRQNRLQPYIIAGATAAAAKVVSAPPNPVSNTQGAYPKAPQKKKGKGNRRNLFDGPQSQTPAANNSHRQNDATSLDNLFSVSNQNIHIPLHPIPNQHSVSDQSLQQMVDDAVRRQLAATHLSRPSENRYSFANPHFLNNTNRNSNNRPNYRPPAHSQQLEVVTDRTSNIISGWHLQFSGQEEDSLSVDDFIYRVQALTVQSLRGNFDVLCDHIHLLFREKALHWYWRFHKTSPRIDWETLCHELGNQFRDSRSDFDITEQLRNRKQRPSEKFDAFYDAILKITDRLQSPIYEPDLIEILKRNLRPEVRKELLYFHIGSISKLREFVKKYEVLEEEINKTRLHKNFIPRRNISEVEAESSPEDNIVEVDEVLEIVCWNCSERGHKYYDCLGERKVFCYGCGAPNTYKPNCLKCNKVPKNYQLQVRDKQMKTT